jgi:serine/threonine protein kinase
MIPASDISGELERRLREVLPENYQDIKFFSQGGTRRIYVSNWGHGNEKRVIKVDINPESPRAIRHVSRGCNTANDLLRLTQIPDPETHNINGVVDYYETEGLTVSVERFFEGQSLEELVEKKPLSLDRFEKVFSQIILTEQYLINEVGLYHRDAKPSNILIGKKDQVRVIDFANACPNNQPQEKVLPTAGGHWIVDPLILSQFTGEQMAYTQSSEMYALGVDMFYSLTGKYIFEFDPDEKTGKVCATGESLLHNRNILDREKYHSALENALQTLPRKARKYSSVIRKCLSLNREVRYDSIDDLAKEFHLRREHDNKFFAAFAGSKAAFIGGLIFTTLSMGTIFGLDYVQEKQKLEQKLVESEKYLVGAELSDRNLEVKNNLFEIDASVGIYGDRRNDDNTDYPRGSFIVAKPGEELSSTVIFKEIARPKAKTEEIQTAASIMTPGKIYIEGFPEVEEFNLYTTSLDGEEFYSEGAFSCLEYSRIKVPEDLADGIYTLVFEAYAPTEEDIAKSHSPNMKRYKFQKPGSIIARKRIPIVVGDPEAKLFSTHIYHGYTEGITVENLLPDYQALPEGVRLESKLSSRDFVRRSDCRKSHSCDVGSYRRYGQKEASSDLLQLAVYHHDKLIHFTFVPISTEKFGEIGESYFTESAIPPNDFHEQTVKLRKDLQDQSR